MSEWTFPFRASRRFVLGALAGLPLSACARWASGGTWNGSIPSRRLIDAHCHLFNITDLPAASFARIVLFKDYEHEGALTSNERKLKKALEGIQGLLSAYVVSAKEEAHDGPDPVELANDPPSLSRDEQRQLSRYQRDAEQVLNSPAFAQRIECPATGPSVSPTSLVSWLHALRSKRSKMTRILNAAHAESGFASRLFCPALVDYGNWLGQELHSPLPDQVTVAGVLARSRSLPPVHGYAPFDPLRLALVRENLKAVDGTFEPLALVRKALTEDGFLGVKLYPPMGFRASGNEQSGNSYPPHVERAFGSRRKAGQALDRSLEDLWRLCLELDAPIMAHAANSVAGGDGFGRRADPSFWLPVVGANPQLRVMLAHFGRFRNNAAGRPDPENCVTGIPFEDSWEAVIGRFVSQNPSSNLFADISYLSEIFDPADEIRAVDRMKLYLRYDPGARHLVFGSDWVMLGVERQFAKAGGYASRVAQFLTRCGLGEAAIDGVMYGNSLRFLGLDRDTGARRRILDFYRLAGLPASRLPN